MTSFFPTTTRECYVQRHVRNSEILAPDCFGFRDACVAGPKCRFAANCVLLKVLYIGLEPYMRVFGIAGREPEWEVDRVPRGKVVGEVLASNVADLTKGMRVKVTASWRTYTWVEITDRTLVEELDPTVPPELYLGLAGSGGRAARLPLEKIVKPEAGQVALVTAVASCVGLCACQLMRMEGVTVVGSCGSDRKVALLRKLGVLAFNYKTEAGAEALARLAPAGLHFLFDNTAGKVRTAAIRHLVGGGVILTSGRISCYDACCGPAGGDEALEAKLIYDRCLHDYGQFLVGHFSGDFEDCTKTIIRLYKRGRLKNFDTTVDGFHTLGEAFVGIFRGANVGRTIVRLYDDAGNFFEPPIPVSAPGPAPAPAPAPAPLRVASAPTPPGPLLAPAPAGFGVLPARRIRPD